jgi:hypothetical protein
MGIPQILMIIFYTLNLGVNLAHHGEPSLVKYNFWSSLLVAVVVFALLWWGGFFGR